MSSDEEGEAVPTALDAAAICKAARIAVFLANTSKADVLRSMPQPTN